MIDGLAAYRMIGRPASVSVRMPSAAAHSMARSAERRRDVAAHLTEKSELGVAGAKAKVAEREGFELRRLTVGNLLFFSSTFLRGHVQRHGGTFSPQSRIVPSPNGGAGALES